MFSVIGVLPEDKQTIVLYNNSSSGIDKLANRITANQVLAISHEEVLYNSTCNCKYCVLFQTTASQIVHTIWWVEEDAKKKKLLSLLADDTLYR